MTEEMFNKIMYLLFTHTEGKGGYCDTGSDMDWSCRSECTKLAADRIEAAFKSGEFNIPIQ